MQSGLLGGGALFIGIALLLVVMGDCARTADRATPAVSGALSEPRQQRVVSTGVSGRANVSGQAHVMDGDTIAVDGVRVRLQGLHCPEAREPGGSAATSAMRGLTRGHDVHCSLTGERTYDRLVGTCYVCDTDLTAAIIRQGVCARCPRYDPGRRYVTAQVQAGAWQGSMPGYCRAGND